MFKVHSVKLMIDHKEKIAHVFTQQFQVKYM